MQKLLTVFTDLIFPPSPESKLIRSTTETAILSLYQPNIHENVTYLSCYESSIIKAAIVENKFYHNQTAARLLGVLLQHWITNNKGHFVFVPIPLSRARLRNRGHNQIETILQTTLGKMNCETTVLQRTVNTTPQSHLPKSKRQKNIKHAFSCNLQAVNPAWETVVLVDDVVTTGATMKAARASLAPHLAPHTKLICLAIAH